MESVETGNASNTIRQNSKKIRVLWFTTSPSLGRTALDNQATVGTSWIEATERLMIEDNQTDLGIAFTWPVDKIRSFTTDQSPTKYFAMPRRPRNKWARAYRRLLSLPESENTIVADCRKVVDDFKPDLVTFFGTETPYPLVIPYLSCPHVIWFQGNLTVYQKKWHAGISLWESLKSESIRDILTGNTDLHVFRLYAHYVQREQKIFRMAENFIGRTTWDKRLVMTMAPGATYHHGEEALRPDFHEISWQQKSNREKIVLFSTFRGNLFKGLECAMEALDILQRLTHQTVEWHVAGIDKDLAYTRASIRKANLQNKQHFKLLGSLNAQDLAKGLLNADIYVHPSHIDNSPNSLCEAMLLGVPCVSTNAGGIPSMLQDFEEGLLVQNGDPYALAGAILQLIEDPQYALNLGRKARLRALARHDSRHITQQIMQTYKAIVKMKENA